MHTNMKQGNYPDIVPLLQEQLTDAVRPNFSGMRSLLNREAFVFSLVNISPYHIKNTETQPQLLTSFRMALNTDLPVFAARTFFEGP